MKSAVQFALAFHLGDYLEQPHVDASDFVIRKMHTRFATTTSIAQIAVRYLEEEIR
jgi:hypothetical protein